VLGEAAAVAGKTNAFLGERYRRLAKCRGTKKAIGAVGRSILAIIWDLLSDPDARFHDLGPGFHEPMSTLIAASATTSATWRRSATTSPCSPPPDRHPSACSDPAALRYTGCCRLPAHRHFPVRPPADRGSKRGLCGHRQQDGDPAGDYA
jgi:hypothetical protein